MFVNNHTCALVLLFGTNCPYECRNNSNVCYQTCDILLFFNLFFPEVKLHVFGYWTRVIFYFFSIYFFLGWNYLWLGIEPLFELSIFTAADQVKVRILYNKVWKDNWDTCQYYIIYGSIGTIWVLVMGIGNVFKIDDRYINIDRWSIIVDNYLLNVFNYN